MTTKLNTLRYTRIELAKTMSTLLGKPPPQICSYCLAFTMKKPWNPYCSACHGTGFGSIDADVLVALDGNTEGNDK